MRRRVIPFCILLVGLGSAFAGPGFGACADMGRADAVAPADSASGELGFRMAGAGGAAIVVPVFINGSGPVDLILDTGATLTCVDTSLARELDLPERRMRMGMAIGVGGAGRVQLRAVDSLRVGGAVARNLSVCAMDLRPLQTIAPRVRGLLGLNVLRHYRVTLDFEREVMRLAASGG